MIFMVVFTFLCLKYGAVEGTFGLYPEYSGLYGSQVGHSYNGWIGGGLESLYSGLGHSSYDTLNSQYSHALYPIGHHKYLRIPVKGGLTVVPAPKHLGLLKGYSGYETPIQRHIPLIKTLPLSYYSTLLNTEHKHVSEVPLVSLPRIITSHSLSDSLHYKNSHLSSYSSAHLSDSLHHLGVHGYKPLKSIKSLKIIKGHGISNVSPVVKTHKKNLSPSTSSHHDSHKVLKHTKISHIHESGDKLVLPLSHSSDIGHELPHVHDSSIGHELPHVHDSSIGHELTHVHDSSIGHELPHVHDSSIGHELSHVHGSSIGHELPLLHDSYIGHGLTHIHDSDIRHHYQPVNIANSGLRIHGSSHGILHDHDDSEEVLEEYDGHHTGSLHESHIEDHDEDIVDSDKEYEPKDEEENLKDPDYSNQEHVDDIPTEKAGKGNKKSTYLQHEQKEEIKTSEPSYIQQKQTDVTEIHTQQDNYKSIQTDEYKSTAHNNKEYGKSLPSIPLRRPNYDTKHYPQFPQIQKKLESYDKVKYAGGRYPVRPLKQSFYEVDHSSKTEEPVVGRHPSYVNPPKIEQQEHDHDYKPIPEVGHRPKILSHDHRHSYTQSQEPKNTHYKAGSAQPRGRSKQYRNYEMPRTSSYEIEILHSESSDNTKDTPDAQYPNEDNFQADSYANSDRTFEEEGEHQSFAHQVSNDEEDTFEYQESQDFPVKQKDTEEFEESFSDSQSQE